MIKKTLSIFIAAALMTCLFTSPATAFPRGAIPVAGDAPVATGASVTVNMDTQKAITLVATDNESDTLTYTITVQPEHGTVTTPTDNACTYEPTASYTGTDSFKFKANDGTTDSNEATITITVVDARPTANDGSMTVDRNKTASGTLPATDPNAGALTFELVTQPTYGTATLTDAAAGTYTYTPNTNVLGSDSFTFKATGSGGVSNIATINIVISIETLTKFPYADLDGHWAEFSAGQIGTLGYVKGESIQSKNYFHPTDIMTRADFVLFLCAVMNVSPETGNPSQFTDVSQSWLIGPINAAKTENIVSGTTVGGKSNFYPNRALTRIEAASFIAKALELPDNSTAQLVFTDKSQVPAWAVGHLKSLVGYDIISGGTDGRVRPNDPITRAEAITMLYKTYKETLTQLSLAARNPT